MDEQDFANIVESVLVDGCDDISTKEYDFINDISEYDFDELSEKQIEWLYSIGKKIGE